MTTSHLYKALLVLALTMGLPGNTLAQGKAINGGPQDQNQISSLGGSLRSAERHPLHILYVHGIGAEGAGDSWIFQKHLCALLKGCKLPKKLVSVGRDYADSGVFAHDAPPPASKYMRKEVWASQEEWRASAPFVDHYLLRRSDGDPVVVDEINWYPLVLSLKCRQMMAGESWLAGPNKHFLDLCSKTEEDPSHNGRYISYDWIKSPDARMLESIRPRGALVNRGLKTSLLDWGFADALMAVGNMHDLFREGMRQLLVNSARFRSDEPETDAWEQPGVGPHRIETEFVVVSHSLGSYLVFSTLNINQQDSVPEAPSARPMSDETTAREDAAAEFILQRTSLVYFFANQIPLLELANLEGPKAADELGTRMQRWRELRQNFGKGAVGPRDLSVKEPQVVAWSDPSDLLAWCLPDMKPLTVVNLYVRNTWWHWLIARPAAAHNNYASNKQVLRMMMSAEPSSAKGEVCR